MVDWIPYIFTFRKARLCDVQKIMNLINEAYCNDKDKKLWINGEQKQRIGSVEQANEMIPNMYVTRNQSSNEIIGIIVAKISDDNGVVIIGPVAIKPKFQACRNPDGKNLSA